MHHIIKWLSKQRHFIHVISRSLYLFWFWQHSNVAASDINIDTLSWHCCKRCISWLPIFTAWLLSNLLGAPLEIQSKEGISCNRPYPRLWNIKAITLGLQSLTKTTCAQCFFPRFPVCIWLLGLNNWREAGWRW